LINAAKIRQTGKMIEQLDAAVNTFHVKYNCLPGDCQNATQFFGTNGNCAFNGNIPATTTCNGNGDGDIFGFSTINANGGQENGYFFQQLILAGLIADTRYCTMNNTTCTTSYEMAFWGLTISLNHKTIGIGNFPEVIGIASLMHASFTSGVTANGAHHAYMFSADSNASDAVLSPATLSMLDSKFDDGYPLSGQIQALAFDGNTVIQNGQYSNNGQFYLGPTACNNVAVTPSVHNTYSDFDCPVMWLAQF
jgi:hypothetical protein